jgi:hypothetical protein
VLIRHETGVTPPPTTGQAFPLSACRLRCSMIAD